MTVATLLPRRAGHNTGQLQVAPDGGGCVRLLTSRMPITRTEAELQSAIETMFRVRAVESPPDESGARTIWHRGSKGADLVTWVDAFGRVTRQELYLFEDCLIWEKATGVRTGASDAREGSKANPAPDAIAFDTQADDDRLVRARRALDPYTGGDKFIIHARMLVGGATDFDDPVTRTAKKMSQEALAEEPPPAPSKAARGMVWVPVAIGVAALAGALAWFLTRAP